VLRARGRHVRPVLPALRAAGDGAVGGDRVAVGEDRAEPAAADDDSRRGEQLEGHRALGAPGRPRRLWNPRHAGRLAHAFTVVAVRRLLSRLDDAHGAPGIDDFSSVTVVDTRVAFPDVRSTFNSSIASPEPRTSGRRPWSAGIPRP